MRIPLRRVGTISRGRALGALTAVACAVGTVAGVGVASGAQAAPTPPGASLPEHVFAPYLYTNSPVDNIYQTVQESGAQYITLAFLQTRKHGDCTVYWNGRDDSPVGPTYADGIAAIRAAGGDVIPSFGGAAAGGDPPTELADSCTDVDAIAAEFERVITAYDFTRIDLDIEGTSLAVPGAKDAIDRRNKAIKKVEDWAKANNRVVEFQYTQPTWTTGLNDGSMYVLNNAVENGAEIHGVHLMTFDYYDDVSEACQAGTGPAHDMGADTIKSATSLYNILHGLYPSKTSDELWGMIGVIEMPGRSDFGYCEAFTTQDAVEVLNWAIQRDIQGISFWMLLRDGRGSTNPKAPYAPWQFTHTFAPFTHRDSQAQKAVTTTVTGNPLRLRASSGSPVVLPPVSLNGLDQVVSGSLGQVTVVDPRGSNAGWSLTGQVSDFREPVGDNLIPAADLGWAPSAALVPGGLNLVRTAGDSTITAGPSVAPGAGLSTPQTLCSAPAGASAGTFTCDATLNLGVPYNTPAGTYTGVLTLTLI